MSILRRVAKSSVTAAAVALPLLSLQAASPARAALASTHQLRTTIAPAAPRPANSSPPTVLAPSRSLHLEFSLSPKPGLADFASAVSTPGTPQYRHFLSAAAFSSRFGASPATVASLSSFLSSSGFTNISLSKNHLFISASAPASTVSTTLHTSLARIHTNSGSYYANLTPASLPSTVAGGVAGVIGLSSVAVPHPLYTGLHPATPTAPSPSSPNQRTTLTTCRAMQKYSNPVTGPYTATQVASAYHAPTITPSSGAGKVIALYELSSFSRSDLAAYDACLGIAPTNRVVKVDGGAGDASGSVEVLLDAEIANAVSPAATALIYEGPNSQAGYIDTYQRIASDDTASIVSVSWGSCEALTDAPTLTAENTLFQEMAAQGQSVFVASGDSGASGCFSYGDPSPQAGDPSAQPFVTSVGGTELVNTSCALLDPNCDVVWNSGGAGGGGASSVFTSPTYQSVLSPASPTRLFPDITASASPATGYLIYGASDSNYTTPYLVIGGTSASSPLEAAILASVASACSVTPGFVNPLLYSTYNTNASIHDITVGTNDIFGINYDFFHATPGFDEASGLGTPAWDVLNTHICEGS